MLISLKISNEKFKFIESVFIFYLSDALFQWYEWYEISLKNFTILITVFELN